MSSHTARAREIRDVLIAAGVNATTDPRSATPPVVLVAPPRRTYDVGCGYSARWRLWALVPGPGNADADEALSGMVDQVAELLPVETADPGSYVLSPDNAPFPAYEIQWLEGIS